MSANQFHSQFGETLNNPTNSSTVSPSDALAGKNYVMLYFSAHWCPPCRQFTPVLIDFYKKLQTSKESMELVFCSLDRDESEYKEYTSNMPWKCMPFKAPESSKLAQKYGARGIPHLVVCDGSGNVITKDGTMEIYNDSQGTSFPWKPKTFGEIWPEQIQQTKDTFLSNSDIKDKYLMLYFSASWCGPCRGFTPQLNEAYKVLKSRHDNFELVFISSDRDQEAFDAYYEKMSFCALPFELRQEKAQISKLFQVSGIPKLIILGPQQDDGDRPLINDNVRSFIQTNNLDEFPFIKKNYGDINQADEINDLKSIVILHENGDDDDHENIKEVAKKIAANVNGQNGEDTISVYWSLDNSALSQRIRALAKLPEAQKSEDAIMIMLDLPDNGGCYKSNVTDITVENAMAFIKAPGPRLQL